MCLGGGLWCCDDNYNPPFPWHAPRPINVNPYIPPPAKKEPKPIPLTGVIVSVKVVDFCAEVTLQQRYENVENITIEATYLFLLLIAFIFIPSF